MLTATPARITVHLVDLDLEPDLPWRAPGLAWGDLHRAAAITDLIERGRFLAGRCVLRAHLAERLGCAPEAVAIRTDACGKPALLAGGPAFSLARRGRWYAIALSDDCPVGVDVEPIGQLAGLDAVVDQMFPPAARAEFLVTSPPARLAVFFRWWVRIEAAAKACGRGLDAATVCLEATTQDVCDAMPGLALAVAGITADRPILTEWRVPAQPVPSSRRC